MPGWFTETITGVRTMASRLTEPMNVRWSKSEWLGRASHSHLFNKGNDPGPSEYTHILYTLESRPGVSNRKWAKQIILKFKADCTSCLATKTLRRNMIRHNLLSSLAPKYSLVSKSITTAVNNCQVISNPMAVTVTHRATRLRSAVLFRSRSRLFAADPAGQPSLCLGFEPPPGLRTRCLLLVDVYCFVFLFWSVLSA
jgi:hypothetical protein